jgi:hypothetical protein
MQIDPAPAARLARSAPFVIVTCTILAVHASIFGLHPTLLADDYAAYVANARAIAHGTLYGMPGYLINNDYAGGADTGQAAYPPGLPLLVAPLVLLFGGDGPFGANLHGLLTAISGLNTVLLALAGGVFATLITRLAGSASGVAGGLLLGCSPLLLDQGALRTPSEPAFLLFLVLALLWDDKIARRAHRASPALAAALAGALTAATALVRIVAGILLPAASLAMLLRQRRLTSANVITCAVALLVLASGFAVMGQGYLASNAAILTSGGRPGAATVWHNFVDLPGNLSVLWDFGWRAPGSHAIGWVHRLTQAGSLIIFAAAAIGYWVRLRRGPGAAELFLIGETLLMLGLPALQQSPRYYAPMSLLLILYAWVACALPARRGPRTAARVTVAGIFLLCVAANLPATLAAHEDAVRFAMTTPQADAAIDWIKANTPAGAVLLTHRPRSFVLFTGRGASDFTSSRADGAFFALARRTGAKYFVVSTDGAQSRAAAVSRGSGMDDTELNLALDGWLAAFADDTAGLKLVYRNDRFRIYSIAT